MKYRLLFSLIMIAVLLAACTAPGMQGSPTLPVQTQTPEAQQAASQATQAAQQALAQELGLNVDAIKLEKIEDMEWPNGCLGLQAPDELCIEVITPGYLFTFSVNGTTYEVRTNLDGQVVRMANSLIDPVGGFQPAFAEKIRQDLAARLGIALELVQITSIEPMEWPDGCLGLSKPDEMCTMAIVPGYRLTLSAGGTTYAFRTDQSGSQVREETTRVPNLHDLGVTLTWNRSGGIAGFCDQLFVFPQGYALAASCKDANSQNRVMLSPEQKSTLQTWIQRFRSFTYEQKDPAVADAMTVSLAFTGEGQEDPSEAEKAAMLEFASQIYTSGTN
jgi:hypothetical protein